MAYLSLNVRKMVTFYLMTSSNRISCLFQVLPDGNRKTYCKHEHSNAIEGYLPNMPTHFMLIPRTPDGFTWPYNKE